MTDTIGSFSSDAIVSAFVKKLILSFTLFLLEKLNSPGLACIFMSLTLLKVYDLH